MKIDYKQKIVLFYGNILCVNADAAYISADRDGEIFAHNDKPVPVEDEGIWQGSLSCRARAMVSFEQNESWKDTLTYCEGEGNEWMHVLKENIAVADALLESGAILREKAMSNVIESFPFGERFLSHHWDAFRKHSGVENAASKEFLDVLTEKVKSPPKLFLGVEKPAYLEDNCLLVRIYYGGELVIPAWSKFISMDSNGRVWVYEEQPEVDADIGSGGGWISWGKSKACDVGWRSENTAEKEWRDSLREVQK